MGVRLSDYFKLQKSQAELDFVDIPLDTDIPLFVDPYSLSIEADVWFVECNNLVVDYFQRVVDSIRASDVRTAHKLLAHLHEPNETHLGFSRGRPAGRGIGQYQAALLHERLSKSKAVRTGKLRDLADCELVIPGISNDKISDITINIVRGKLVEYTESQCALLGIPTGRVASGMYWDGARGAWANSYAHLPVYNGTRIVLVPKAAIRYHLSVDHQDYYCHFVLNYFQAEHLEAGSALITVLKNGKRRVYKKDLKKMYPCSKEFLFEFSEKHPDVLAQYKQSLPSRVERLMDEEIERFQASPRDIDVIQLIRELEGIETGDKEAGRYHNFIMGALESIFYPSLYKPRKEHEIHEGRKRIDIVFNNGRVGFFDDLYTLHRIKCPYVFFECKNYTHDPKNPEFDQLAGRFSERRGKFGILVCRHIKGREKMLMRCRDIVHDGRGFILVLEDLDIKTLLELRAREDYKGVRNYLDELFRKLVM